MLAAAVAALVVFPLRVRAGGAPLDEAAPRVEAAKVSVEGLGWWKNRRARQLLRLVEAEDRPPATIDAAYLEDAALVLQSQLEGEGFLRASGVAELMRDGKLVGAFPWQAGGVPEPPRDVLGDAVVFRVERGVRFTFESLEFQGLPDGERKVAEAFFVSKGFLLEGSAARLFTPTRLRSGWRICAKVCGVVVTPTRKCPPRSKRATRRRARCTS